jgi:hypothetical protein
MAVFGECFDFLEVLPYGGSILMPLLDDIASNFETDDPASSGLLEMLLRIEDALLDAGELTSDFVYFVARPKA